MTQTIDLNWHLVHLYREGQYFRTLPATYTAAAAEAYAANFNRLGEAAGLSAEVEQLRLQGQPGRWQFRPTG